ncbi:hypothetical protein GOP47_0002306 [Adiantum capillus-veneris]|uniref:Succinate dehydrogenase subunit 5, mitochondrial n=1 Tax=Adiantum capillus-veneris TaxID=13818 RepID=A0A9D4VBH6_ADICA|nr:hypothetical protein GOP47_0002306 [Adiantum capillus-veneris]
MASRLMASRTSRVVLLRALRPLFSPPSRPPQALISPNFSYCRPDDFGRFSIGQFQAMSTSIANLPDIADTDVLRALKSLIAEKWTDIPEETEDAVEAALTKKTDDTAGIEQLKNAWRAAEAVEKFSGTLVSIRMALDDLTGASGEKVRPLPPPLLDALNAVFSRYKNYLAAFNEDEFYLKKKVEVELGTLLVHIGQRCSGLSPEWGNISLLGTTGLSGSFIEHRAA